MPLPRLPFGNLTSSRQLVSGNHINNVNNMLSGTATLIAATPAGTALSSLTLDAAFNEISTVASAADSVTLPLAKSGLRVCVTNSGGGNSLKVWAKGTDLISGATSLAVASTVSTIFVCIKDGVWKSFNLT